MRRAAPLLQFGAGFLAIAAFGFTVLQALMLAEFVQFATPQVTTAMADRVWNGATAGTVLGLAWAIFRVSESRRGGK